MGGGRADGRGRGAGLPLAAVGAAGFAAMGFAVRRILGSRRGKTARKLTAVEKALGVPNAELLDAKVREPGLTREAPGALCPTSPAPSQKEA